MTLQFLPQSVTSRAMRERNVVICDIVEEMNLILFEHQASRDGVDGCVSPSLVEESAITIEGVEEVDVGL